MKKELLRIYNFNMVYNASQRLSDISLSLLAGEVIGLLGLINSGRSLLTKVLYSDIPLIQTRFYEDRRPVFDLNQVRKTVYRIGVSNYTIDNWTVADYISLDTKGLGLSSYNRRSLIATTRALFERFDLSLDPRKCISQLTELEKRLMDLMKAFIQDKRILIIEDEFEGCSVADIEYFKEILQRVIQQERTVIVNSHSMNVSQIMSDQFIIFRGGMIVKKCSKTFIENNEHLEEFMMDSETTTKKKSLDSYRKEQANIIDYKYGIQNIFAGRAEPINLKFRTHEVVAILTLDIRIKSWLFHLISGRLTDRSIQFFDYKENRQMKLADMRAFFENKIVSVKDVGGKDELLLSMSLGDNLLLPSLDKLSSMQYVMAKQRLEKLLENELKDNMGEMDDYLKPMGTNELISIVLERWYIYKPKILVLFEPFVHCDIYGVSLVKSYIKKFADLGTTVIIVKSREEYILDISDRIIRI